MIIDKTTSRVITNLTYEESVPVQQVSGKAPHPEVAEGFYGIWCGAHPEEFGALVDYLEEYDAVDKMWALEQFIDWTLDIAKSNNNQDTVVVSAGEAADLMLHNKARAAKEAGTPEVFWEFVRSWAGDVSEIEREDAFNYENDIYITLSEVYENCDLIGKFGLKLRIIPISMDHTKLDAVIQRTSGTERQFDIVLYYRRGTDATRRNLIRAIQCILKSFADEK